MSELVPPKMAASSFQEEENVLSVSFLIILFPVGDVLQMEDFLATFLELQWLVSPEALKNYGKFNY